MSVPTVAVDARVRAVPDAAVVGPEMRELWQRFPARPAVGSWPATEIGRDDLMALLGGVRFAAHDSAHLRRRGHARLLAWLSDQPGATWQQRWQASGADALGNADWWRPLLAQLRPDGAQWGVSTSSNLRVCVLHLICADVIRPSVSWVLTPRAPQNLVALMTMIRDPDGFAALTALCDGSAAGRTMKAAALRRAATILAVKGGGLRDITVGDCLELSVVIDGRSVRKNRGMGFYQLLHTMGVFGPDAPSTIRAFGGTGQLSPAQLIDRHDIACRPIRDVLVDYLQDRQPMLDYPTMENLASSLGGLFWRDLERHHPGIDSLHLQPGVAAGWKQRAMFKTRRVTGPGGEISEVREPRAAGLDHLATVRAFYLDIAQWAMEDPGRWGPWAAPCPIRPEDLARQKTIRARKSRMDQRTRERLPVLPVLLAHLQTTRNDTAARLRAAHTVAPGALFTFAGVTLRRVQVVDRGAGRVWAEEPSGTGKRRDLTGEEHRSFWTWAAAEVLRHTGIRIEELTELSHHSLIQYTLPGTGELVPLLQIAPSKTDTERLLVISPELADVLAAIITRIRGGDAALGCVASYDTHERQWNPPMPLLFQRRISIEHRAIPGSTIRDWLDQAMDSTGLTDQTGRPLRFTPHDFRRLFITDAVMHGMPPHIAQLVAGHRDINTTMGYKAVYPDEVINGHRAFIARRRALRPGEEYRQPTDQEWDEFLGHFERRKVALGTCGRSYATPCIHEHACLRCPLLRPDPTQRDRLLELRDNLIARIAEARTNNWLGEVDGLQVSLNGAREKLTQLDQRGSTASTQLSLPTFRNIAGRATTPTD